MSTIYSNASEVIAWLGPSKDDSDHALNLLSRWGKALADVGIEEYMDVPDQMHRFEDTQVASNLISSIHDPFNKRALEALTPLYNREYWRRLWVFQEFVLAMKVFIMCGSARLPGDYLITDIFFRRWEEVFNDPETGLSENIFELVRKNISYRHINEKLFKLLSWREMIWSSQRSSDRIVRLFYEVLDLDCSDKRDKIFGVLGVGKRLGETIDVDYSRSVNDTYIELARHCIA
jgi:hypothetical protein